MLLKNESTNNELFITTADMAPICVLCEKQSVGMSPSSVQVSNLPSPKPTLPSTPISVKQIISYECNVYTIAIILCERNVCTIAIIFCERNVFTITFYKLLVLLMARLIPCIIELYYSVVCIVNLIDYS